jgi:ATP-binding cassette subfamily B protein
VGEWPALRRPLRPSRDVLLGFFGVFRYSRRAVQLVWETNRSVAAGDGAADAGGRPVAGGVAWIGAQIVDAVVYARGAAGHNAARVLRLVLLEGCLVAGSPAHSADCRCARRCCARSSASA